MENISDLQDVTDTVVEATTETAAIPGERTKNIRLSGRPFLMINVRHFPAITNANATVKDEDGNDVRRTVTPTHKAGWWKEKGSWVGAEQTSIVDRVKDRHLTDTNVIIDILRGELIKSNLPGHDQTHANNVVEHFLSKYMEVCKTGVDRYLTKMAQAHIAGNGDLASLQAKIEAAEVGTEAAATA